MNGSQFEVCLIFVRLKNGSYSVYAYNKCTSVEVTPRYEHDVLVLLLLLYKLKSQPKI